VLVKDFL